VILLDLTGKFVWLCSSQIEIGVDVKNDPFSMHGIEHLSSSSCNMFEASPAAFLLSYVMKKKGQVGAAAHRGTSVELGIVHGLTTGASKDDCVNVAEKEFWRLNALSGDPRSEKEKLAVSDMVKIGLAELLPYGKPSSTQGKIEYRNDNLAVPIIGYYDFLWEKSQILIDLKTTHALPSKISNKHARQVALYCAATGGNIDGRLTYVTPKKCATYRLENIAEHVKAVERIALTIQKFLSLSADPDELASFVVPDTSSFYFNDEDTRQLAFEIWGI